MAFKVRWDLTNAWARTLALVRVIPPAMVLLGVIIVAAALRGLFLRSLGDFDFDEVASVWYARSTPTDIVEVIARAPFEHPPLYYVGLHYWTTWFGEDEAIVRWLSGLFGFLLIPATFRFARCYLPSWPAVLVAAIVAGSPLLIFFSREARMYMPAALLATLALWMFERAMRRGRRIDWVWLGLAVLVGIYVDYTAALALVAMNLVLPWRLATQRRGVIVFVLLEVVGILLVLPWILMSSGLQDSLPAFGSGDFGIGIVRDVLSRAWMDVFVGDVEVRGGGRSGLIVATVFALLALAGCGIVISRRVGGLLLAQLIAVLGFLTLLLVFDKPYQARYVLPAVPVLSVLAVLPVSFLSRRTWLVAPISIVVLVMLVGPVYASRAYYDEYRRGDYRSITATVESLARPRRPGRDEGKFRDAVILAGPWQGWYWRHYFPGFLDKVDVWFLPDEVPPAVTAEEVNAKLSRAAHNHRRLWVVLAGLEQADPEKHVEAWLATQWQARSEIYRNGVLQLYMTNVLDLVDRRGHVDIGEDFETNFIQFTGARADQGPREAGDGVRFTLFMRAKRDVSYDLRVRVWLRTPRGDIYSKDLVAQNRSQQRTSEWLPGETYQVRTALWVPAEAAPGSYQAFVAFLTPDDRALIVNGAFREITHPSVSYLWLGPVDITEPSISLGNEAALRESVGGPIR